MQPNPVSGRSHILFDLDGTLIASAPGVIDSVCYALTQLGLPVPEDRQCLRSFVGPPLKESFATFYGLSPEETAHAIRLYRVHYEAEGMWNCTVYPGIPQLLAQLNQAGKRLLVATSKPEKYAVPLLTQLGLAEQFHFIAGASADLGGRTEKHQVLQYALAHCGLTAPSQMLLVGDRKYDVLGAKKIGMDTLGVLYGYGSREELLQAGAIALADTPQAVGALLL